jgi:hypothetical protein
VSKNTQTESNFEVAMASNSNDVACSVCGFDLSRGLLSLARQHRGCAHADAHRAAFERQSRVDELALAQSRVRKLLAAPPCQRCHFHVTVGAPASLHLRCVYADDHADDAKRFASLHALVLASSPPSTSDAALDASATALPHVAGAAAAARLLASGVSMPILPSQQQQQQQQHQQQQQQAAPQRSAGSGFRNDRDVPPALARSFGSGLSAGREPATSRADRDVAPPRSLAMSDSNHDVPRRRPSDANQNRALSRDSGSPARAPASEAAVIDVAALPPVVRAALLRTRAEPQCDDCTWQVQNPMRPLHENCDRASEHRLALRRLDWLTEVARRAQGGAALARDDLFAIPEERAERAAQLMVLHSVGACESCQFRPSLRGPGRMCELAFEHKAARAKYEWLAQNVLMIPVRIKSNVGSFETELRPLATLADVRAQLSAETNRVAEKISAGDRHARDDAVELLSLIKHTPELTVRFGDFTPIAADQPVDCSRCRRRNKAEALFCAHCNVLLPEHLVKSRFIEPSDKQAAAELCTFCQEEITTGAVVSILGCFHMFHHLCIVSWLRENPACPTCKVVVDKSNISMA